MVNAATSLQALPNGDDAQLRDLEAVTPPFAGADPTETAEPQNGARTAARMPKLVLSYMWPRRHAKAAESLAGLAQIDFVEFSHTKKIHGVQVFVLDVYLKRRPSRIPTNRMSRAGSIVECDSSERESIAPNYTIQRTLRDIQALRYHSWVYARRVKNDACVYCAAFQTLTHSRHSHTRLMALVWPSNTTRRHILESFLNEIVTTCVDGLTSLPRSHCCEGFENIPVRVERFLRRRYTIDHL